MFADMQPCTLSSADLPLGKRELPENRERETAKEGSQRGSVCEIIRTIGRIRQRGHCGPSVGVKKWAWGQNGL